MALEAAFMNDADAAVMEDKAVAKGVLTNLGREGLNLLGCPR